MIELVFLLFGMIFFFFFILLYMNIPAWELFMAKIQRKPVLVLITPDGTAEIRRANLEHDIYTVKIKKNKFGYIITRGSTYPLQGVGQSLGIGFLPIGRIPTMDLAMFATYCKEFLDLRTIDDALDYFKRNGGSEVKIPALIKSPNNTKMVVMHTIRVQDIVDFLESGESSSMIISALEKAKLSELKRGQINIGKWVIWIAIAVFSSVRYRNIYNA